MTCLMCYYGLSIQIIEIISSETDFGVHFDFGDDSEKFIWTYYPVFRPKHLFPITTLDAPQSDVHVKPRWLSPFARAMYAPVRSQQSFGAAARQLGIFGEPPRKFLFSLVRYNASSRWWVKQQSASAGSAINARERRCASVRVKSPAATQRKR